MGWSVATRSQTIDVGSTFCVTESQQGDAPTRAIPQPGDAFPVEVANGLTINLQVVEASHDELLISGINGRWRLTPWRAGDGPKSVSVPGMYSTYWVARSGV
jgi:hypothetical protein